MINRVELANSNRQAYDCLAGEYETKASIRMNATLDRVKYFSDFIFGRDVLDIGCGIGQDIKHFINLGYKVTGIDISPKMAECARRRNPGAKIIVGDFLTLDLNSTFDAISALSFLHLFPVDIAVQVIKKIKKILNPGGVALFVVGSDKSQEGWVSKADYHSAPLRYKKFWAPGELRHYLVDVCGFELLSSIIRVGEGKKWNAVVVRKPDNYG